MNKINGIVKVIGTTKQLSEKFKSREFVITVADDKYPQHISLQCNQDKVVMLDNLKIGTEIECSINLRGREWTSPTGEVKHFNTIECWKLEIVGQNSAPQQQCSDDLPF